MKKVYKSLEKNGIVIITEFILNEDKTSPLFSILFNLNMFKQGNKWKTYTFSEIKSWLEEVGFKEAEKKKLAWPHTMIIAYK